MAFLEEEMTRRKGLESYVDALEEERKKMLVFHRELPFSLDLVSRVLEGYRSQLAGGGESVEEEPVLKEFIPTNGGSLAEETQAVEEERSAGNSVPDWLRGAQLCDPQRETSQDPTATPGGKAGVPTSPLAAPAVGGGGRTRDGGDEKEGQGQRKARRCWSPELHHRFLQALQQLGGSHAATPKQIRDLMKVDGLTNDEVKSHLQKYRLHTRRGSPSGQVPDSTGEAKQPQPQIVFIGGMWVPPSGSPTGATPLVEHCTSPVNRVYAPVASIPSQQQRNKRQRLMSCGEDRSGGTSNSDDSATSMSSSHTVTTTESPRR